MAIAHRLGGRAASPRLTSVRPLGGQRGTEVEVNFRGDRLADAQEVLFYQPGISATKLEAVADNHVKATLKIAGDCRWACMTSGSGRRPG